MEEGVARHLQLEERVVHEWLEETQLSGVAVEVVEAGVEAEVEVEDHWLTVVVVVAVDHWLMAEVVVVEDHWLMAEVVVVVVARWLMAAVVAVVVVVRW